MSPIRIKVDPSHDASKVKAEGPGLSRTGKKIYAVTLRNVQTIRNVTKGLTSLHTVLLSSGIELNKPTHFTVNTKGAGKAKLDAQFTGPNKGEAVRDFEIINNHDNTHTVKYTPVQQVTTGFCGRTL